MTNDEKQALMQPLIQLAQHYGLLSDATVSFKKREALLEQLKSADAQAWQCVSDAMQAAIRLDRIRSDKEKEEKNTEHWRQELAQAEKEKEQREAALSDFLKGTLPR